jgi:hypothetical protein
MTLNEFIKTLQKLQKEGKGDFQVVVAQYRDFDGGGADYDEDVKPYPKEEKKLIYLYLEILTSLLKSNMNSIELWIRSKEKLL